MASNWVKDKLKKIKDGATGLFQDRTLQGDDDNLVWYLDLEKYAYGKYSYAVVKATDECEDYSQIIPGPEAAFVGVYDGHNGHQASQFISQNLSRTLIRNVRNTQSSITEVVEGAFADIERRFLVEIEKDYYPLLPDKSTVGSCCLVGIMHNKNLILANLGDSKAVLGWYDLRNRCMRATQLTHSHGIRLESERRALREGRMVARDFLVNIDGAWLVKGMPNLHTTHAIGDGYLKEARFNSKNKRPFYLSEYKLSYPVISAEPVIRSTNIRLLVDRFLIFASGGFWDHFTNEEVVQIVHDKPKQGIARRLIVCAMNRAAQKRNMTYNEVKQIPAGEERRAIHEDMTVIVLFIDHKKFYMTPRQDLTSAQAYSDLRGHANFRI